MLPRLLKALPCGLLIFAVAASAQTNKKTSHKLQLKAVKKVTQKRPLVRKGGEQWFLSHSEFSALTRVEQKQYLKGIKKVLSSLPEKSSTFAKTDSKTKRSIASETKLLSTGVERLISQAEQWRGHPPLPFEYTEESRHEEFRQKWENSMWWVITARVTYAKVPDSDPGKKALGERIEAMEDFYLNGKKISETSFAQNGELKDVYTKLQQAKKGEVNFSTPGLIPSGALVDVAGGQKIEWHGPAEEKPAEKSPRIVDISGQKPAQPIEQLPSLRGYRCMYAGFVIKQDPCRGPQELPDDMSFKGIDSEKLTCSDGHILCNPLLFGLKTSCSIGAETTEQEAKTCLQSAAPLCVAKGKFATRECGTQSASEGYLGSAAALIRANPEVWNDYLMSFYELCDDKMIVLNEFAQIKNGEPRDIPESTLADIEQTCTNAKKQLTQIAADYRIETGRPATASPADTQRPADTVPEETETQQ